MKKINKYYKQQYTKFEKYTCRYKTSVEPDSNRDDSKLCTQIAPNIGPYGIKFLFALKFTHSFDKRFQFKY